MKKLLILCFLGITAQLFAQEAMEVQRCADIDRYSPILNIYMDGNNNKWVADEQGLFLAQSPDFASTVNISADQWSLLSAPDGNEELNLPKNQLTEMMGDDFNFISAALLDKTRNEILIGTSISGIYRFKFKPQLQLLDHWTTQNSKLKSDKVQAIASTPDGKVYVGTDNGMLEVKGGDNKLIVKYFDIEAITQFNGKIWVIGDQDVLEMDNKGRLYSLDAEKGMIDGELKDIDFDSQGRLWIASEIVTRYNFETETFDRFGPAEDFTSQYVNCIAIDSDDALWVGTDDKGVYFIGKASTMSASIVIETELGCDAEAKNAAIRVRASGGEPPYDYQWSGGLTGENPGNLGPGTFTVTVLDKKGKSTKAQITIEDPRLTITMNEDRPASPGGDADGIATLNVSGGNPGYKFIWDNGEKGQTAKRLKAGSHSVTITDASGCSTTGNIDITSSLAELTMTLEEAAPVKCNGAANGSIKAIVKGGKKPYQFQFPAGNTRNEVAQNLGAGNYIVTVTDATGNAITADITLEQPQKLAATTKAQSAATLGQKDGKAKSQAQGGLPPYTFSWDNGETGAEATKLGEGKHFVTITDTNGCAITSTTIITEDILPLAVSIQSKGDILCAGDQNANLTAEVNGGKPPFQYQWSTEKGQNDKANGLGAGAYQVTVSDATGSQANAEIAIKAPKALTATVVVKSAANTNQSDGKAKASVDGGVGKYTYQWDTGETGETASKLGAGSHTVTVTDKNGCSTTASVTITEDILPLTVNLKVTETIKCSGESTAALLTDISGGKGPFSYAWSTDKDNENAAKGLASGDYEVTVTDATGTTASIIVNIKEPKAITATATAKSSANTNQKDGKATVKASGGAGKFTYKWDTGESGETAANLGAGSHTVTVTDKNGCTTSTTVTITEDILPLSVNLTSGDELKCAGDNSATLSAEVSGGKGPFSYAWSTDKGNENIAKGLAAGNYEVTVTDVTGTTATFKSSIKAPDPVAATATAKSSANTNQKDGKATVKASGGAGKFTYKWDTGESGETAANLGAGSHSVTVTDKNGCSATATATITEDILPLTVSLKTSETIKCAGESTAALLAEVNGGKSPFQYQWSTDKGQKEKATNLASGDYLLTITDATGTTAATTFSVKAPEKLNGSIKVLSPANTNTTDGKATIKVTGGSAPYKYKWDTGETVEKATKLAAGNRSVTVTDNNGCSAVANIEITEDIQPLAVKLSTQTDLKCAGESNAKMAVEVSGGKPPYQYNWSDGKGTGETAVNLSAGTYEVTVTDAAGNQKSNSLELKGPAALIASIDKNKPTTNENSKDGKATLKISGGTKPYTYNWDNGETKAKAEKLAFGAHQVTISDANNCSTNLDFQTEKKIMPALTAGLMRTGQTLQVSNLYFQADSTDMTVESYPALDEIVDFLEESPTVVIEVGGHTNDVPPHDYCDALSSARAKSVADYITTKGIDPNRVFSKGYGKRKPKFSNRTADGRKKNQRVEIKILRLQ